MLPMTLRQHRPRKRFGQHFLRDEWVVQKIAQHVFSGSRVDHLVEIGPGEGALTKALLAYTANLDVIEIDRDLIPVLQERFKLFHGLNIIAMDAMKFDYSELVYKDEKLCMVGNLPYNISTALIFYLLGYRHIVSDMYFMLQKEVVERIASAPGSKTYGRLSVMVQYYCSVDILFDVGRDAFVPKPNVSSTVVHLIPHVCTPYLSDYEAVFAEIVREAFCQRRKTIKNTLKSFLNSNQLQSLGIDPGSRAEALSVKNFVDISNYVGEITG